MASFSSVLSSTMASGAKASALQFRFDVTNVAAQEWARRRAAELVTAITEDARAAIRTVIRLGFEQSLAPRTIARDVRATIGLTERDAQAVMTRQIKLLASGADVEKATAAAERYATQLRNTRALTIARTETMRAANEGQLQLWRQAQTAGALPENARKVWITADPCPLCAPLDGETVLLNDDFSIGQDPPAHPRCKCTIGFDA